MNSSHAHKMRFCYLLGMFSKISDEHPRHFHRRVPPGFNSSGRVIFRLNKMPTELCFYKYRPLQFQFRSNNSISVAKLKEAKSLHIPGNDILYNKQHCEDQTFEFATASVFKYFVKSCSLVPAVFWK